MKFGSIVGWCIAVGLLLFCLITGLNYLLALQPENAALGRTATMVLDWTTALGRFISPILQLTLILALLIGAAERLGFIGEGGVGKQINIRRLAANNNVQAFIAVVLISAVVIGALADIQRIDVLKDLALVVVGFYFGRRQGETESTETVKKETRYEDINPAA